MEKFRIFIADLVWMKRCLWLHALIDILCQIEMYVKIMINPDYYRLVSGCRVINVSAGQTKARMEDIIPHNTLYCEDCKFRRRSMIARFFFGNQADGYCDFLGRGDFSFMNPTELLWDGCKECRWYDEIQESSSDI